MSDDELVEALRQTFRDKADGLVPSPGTAPSARLRSRRVPRPGRRLALASLATALAAGAAAAIVTLNDHPSPAHNVSIAGPASTSPAPSTASGLSPATSSPGSSAPPTSAPPVTTAPAVLVPAGFQPLSVTFVSAHTGWVLGTAPCGTSTCTTLVRTSDGGATWTEVSQPPIALNASTSNSAAWVRFVNLDTGWIVAPSGSQTSSLWTTDNGGKDWAQEPNPGGASAHIVALEASNGLVHLVEAEPGTGADRIFTSPVGHQDWTASAAAASFGAGPVPSSQMILLGTAGWLVDVNRTVVSGARLSPAGWTAWTPPCSDANGPGYLAASSTTNLYAVCDEGVWGTPAPGTTSNSQWLYASTNGGGSFSPVGPLPAGTGGGMITAAPGTATIVFGTDSGMIATFDGGKSWQVVSTVAGISYVGFTTAGQGVALSQQTAGSSEPRLTMLMTRDGGHTWTPVTF
jgi:Photosynthesis system II assembly factor YCF48